MTFLATCPNPATCNLSESCNFVMWGTCSWLWEWKKEVIVSRGAKLSVPVLVKKLATCTIHNLSCDWLFSWENWNVGSQYLRAAASIIWSYGARQKYITFKLEKCSRIYFGFGQWWRIYLNKNFIKIYLYFDNFFYFL